MVAALLVGVAGLAAGEISLATVPAVRALVIGIDEYVELRNLRGAVNDARDVAKVLKGIGVGDLVTLENGTATRQRITAEWNTLVARANPGDTIVLTYAGHGGREPERNPGEERDGQDEVLLLGGFRSSGEGTRERIFDNELHQWFADAGARGLRVVFVADSCHSGTLTRSLDPRVSAPGARTARYTIFDDQHELERLMEMADPEDSLGEDEMAHVSFLAAGQDNEEIHELPLPNEAGNPELRGLLSYTFARAVEGKADIDGDGVLRRDELWRFVRENVRMKGESRQTPNLLPNRRGDEPVLRLIPATVPVTTAVTPPTPEPAPASGGAKPSMPEPVLTAPDTERPTPEPNPLTDSPGPSGPNPSSTPHGADPGNDLAPVMAALRLTILNADAPTAATVAEALAGVRMVPITDFPDLVWDTRRREVVSGLGDVVAYDVDLADLPHAIDKWEAVRSIRALSERASLRLRVYPDDGTHRHGNRIEVGIDGLRYPSLTLLGLAGDGTVHYLYPDPRRSDPETVDPGRPFSLELEVTPPFGADHIVAISAATSLGSLNAKLLRLDGRRAARRVAELLADAAADADQWWSGIQGLFTAPSPAT